MSSGGRSVAQMMMMILRQNDVAFFFPLLTIDIHTKDSTEEPGINQNRFKQS